MSSKKSRSKSKSRPLTTSQPTSGHPSILSSFSPDGTLFVIITLAIDKHRLRLYNTSSTRVVAEHTFESSRVSALTWGSIKTDTEVLDTPNKKRKKRKFDSDTPQNEKRSADTIDVVVLGLQDGTIIFFSLSSSKIVRTLTHPSSPSSVIALALKTVDTPILWTSSSDGIVRLWDVQKHKILSSWHDKDHIPYTSLSLRPTSDSSQTDVLAGHHHIRLFSDTTLHDPQSTPLQLASFTGHASSIMILHWAHAPAVSHRFFSMAVSDRFVYVWDTVKDSSLPEKPVAPLACVALDSDVRTIGLNSSDFSRQTLVTLSVSGKLSFVPIPESFAPPPNTRETKNKMFSLLPHTSVASSSNTRPLDPIVIDIICVPGDSHSVRIARLIKGVKPVFEDVRYLDDDGNYIQNLSLEPIEEKDWDAMQSVQPKRYAEPAPLGLASGLDIDQPEPNNDAEMQAEIDGSLQVNLAELSLGQRLKAVSQKGLDLGSDMDDDASNKTQTKPRKKQNGTEIPVVAANSLTRTLIQALHSSDTRLLEMCLTHSDPTLIRNTVRRLPPQLAIPLITSCVERLGKRNNVKGGGGGASSQRGSSLVAWLKTVLVIHAGHLMTIPDLVTRLSGLHTTLTARLNLHHSLLSLSGRLDMVLSQIELRSSPVPTTLTSPAGKRDKVNETSSTITRYVEGESDSSNEEDTDVVVEIEHDDVDAIEDVELDGGSEDDDDDMSSESEDDEEGTVHNSFIDDEAEEEYSDEANEDDSE